jgi:hypothetical protein
MQILRLVYSAFVSLLTKLIQNPKNFLIIFPEIFSYIKSVFQYKRTMDNIEKFNYYPILFQRNLKSSFDSHYVYQAYWATKIIKQINPGHHTDISSNISFVAQLAAILPVEYFEFNPPDLIINNIRSAHCDLRKLPFADSSLKTVSCLHVLEHIGLGRYGDEVNPNGMKNACKELIRCVAEGGSLIVSFPVGKHSVEFNAHRITNPLTALTYFPTMKLKKFSYVDDHGLYIENANPEDSVDMNYACGMFWLIKTKLS